MRLRVRTNSRVKSLSDGNTGLSVAEGNCVVERRGGEQPEAKDQSINNELGTWWDVPVAEVSSEEQTRKTRENYEKATKKQRPIFA